jgi:hypothetical protein
MKLRRVRVNAAYLRKHEGLASYFRCLAQNAAIFARELIMRPFDEHFPDRVHLRTVKAPGHDAEFT